MTYANSKLENRKPPEVKSMSPQQQKQEIMGKLKEQLQVALGDDKFSSNLIEGVFDKPDSKETFLGKGLVV